MLEIRDVCGGYPEREVLHGVSLDVPKGQVSVLLGPNGCGKSTLLKTLCGILPAKSGQALQEGEDLLSLRGRDLARKIAYLAQERRLPDITVGRMVLHGRFPYLDYPRRYRKCDREIAVKAMEWVGAQGLEERSLPQLSGGERQKVYLAMALAQDTETIFMDEPTTYLDVRHQLEVMEMAQKLAAEGKAVVAVLHDLCLALRSAHRIGVLAQGRLQALDTPDAVFRSGILGRVFGVSLGRTQTEQGWQYYYDYPQNGGAT